MLRRIHLGFFALTAVACLLGYLVAPEELSTLVGAEEKKAPPPVSGEQLTVEPGSPAATAEVRRRDQSERLPVEAVLASAGGAAQGRAERALDHDG